MFGLDLLGIGDNNFDVPGTASAWPSGFALGLFDGGWPNAFAQPALAAENAATTILRTNSCPAIRVQMWWGGSPHGSIPKQWLQKRAPVWEKIALANPGRTIYLSPTCEYSESNRSIIQGWVDTIRNLAPTCVPVLTPMPGKPTIPGVIIEKHGIKAACGSNQIASFDGGTDKGDGIFDVNAPAWMSKNSNAEITFLWAPRFNLSESHNILPPHSRVAAPGRAYIRGVSRLAFPMGEIPAQRPGLIPIKSPFIWKTFAEDMQGDNGRDNRPLLIIRGKSRSCDILTLNNIPLGKLVVSDSPGAYPGGLTRYYSGVSGGVNLYAWQLEEKARQLSSSSLIKFRIDGKYFGPVHAAFRWGEFRT